MKPNLGPFKIFRYVTFLRQLHKLYFWHVEITLSLMKMKGNLFKIFITVIPYLFQ